MTGTLYGISLGPGDPELITVKGLRLLHAAHVVFMPVAEISERSVAASIAQPLLRDGQQIEEIVFAMRRPVEERAAAWRAAADRIAKVLCAGQDAAFLVEGDALTYSTFAHLVAVLHERHPELAVEVVPGVTSFAAASARTGLALADADQRIAVLPAVYAGAALETTLRDFDTVVLLKIAGGLSHALDTLEATGRIRDAVFVERCGQPGERVVTDVRSLRGMHVDYFSLIIVRRDSAQLAIAQGTSGEA